MLSLFIGILTVLIAIVSVLLILIVLMQRPKQEGLGAAFGGGMMDSLAGAHTTDVLQKGTVWLATIFLSSAILLAVLKTQQMKGREVGEVLPPPPPPAETPFSPESPSLLNFPPAPEPAKAPAETPKAVTPAPAPAAPKAPAETPKATTPATPKAPAETPKATPPAPPASAPPAK